MPVRDERYRAFFQPLLDQMRARDLTGAAIAQPQPFLFVGSRARHLSYEIRFAGHGQLLAGVVLRAQDDEVTKAAFDLLTAERERLERQLGAGPDLQWERRDGHHTCTVFAARKGAIADPESAHKQAQSWALRVLERMHDILLPAATDALTTATSSAGTGAAVATSARTRLPTQTPGGASGERG